MIVKFERNANSIKCDGVNVPIIAQKTKGENQEYVNIEKLGYSEYQKHIKLSNIAEGESEYELKDKRNVQMNHLSLTEEEKGKIDKLQAQIDAIKQSAKERYNTQKLISDSLNNKIDIASLTNEQKQKMIDMLTK